MDYLESPSQSFDCLIIIPDLLDRVLRSHNKPGMFELHHSSFSLSSNSVMVSPVLEETSKHLIVGVHVIHDDNWLTLISIEPLVPKFSIEVTIWCKLVSSHSTLSKSALTPYPHSSSVRAVLASNLVVLGNLGQIPVVLNEDVRW